MSKAALRLHGLEMSCENGQIRCEDKNMEADRNKRGLGERRKAEREKGDAASDGGPEVLKRLCWHGGQRPFSCATTSLFLPSKEQHAGAGSVASTHTHRQTPIQPVFTLTSSPLHNYLHTEVDF